MEQNVLERLAAVLEGRQAFLEAGSRLQGTTTRFTGPSPPGDSTNTETRLRALTRQSKRL